MVVVVLIGSCDAVKRIKDGVRDLAPASANMQVVGGVLDACCDLCDVLGTFEFGNRCSQSYRFGWYLSSDEAGLTVGLLSSLSRWVGDAQSVTGLSRALSPVGLLSVVVGRSEEGSVSVPLVLASYGVNSPLVCASPLDATSAVCGCGCKEGDGRGYERGGDRGVHALWSSQAEGARVPPRPEAFPERLIPSALWTTRGR